MQTPAFVAKKTVSTWKLFRGLIWVAAAMAACLCPSLALGQTNSTWNGGTGNWSTSTDWTPNQVPNNGGGNTYTVTIGSNGPDTVTLNQNATVASLTLGDVTGSHLSQLTSASGEAEDLTVTGSLTLNKQGWLFMNSGSNITAANVTSSGLLALDAVVGDTGTGSTLTVTGTYTNNFYGGLWVANGDVANIGAIVNNGAIFVGAGSTLNLTNQPNGITDISSGTVIELQGSFNAGSNSALANLASIEGSLQLWNGESLNLYRHYRSVQFFFEL